MEGLGPPKTFKNQWFDVRLTFAFLMHKPNTSSTRRKRILRRSTQSPIRLQLLPRKCGEILCPGYMFANESTSRSGLQQQLTFALPLPFLRFAFVSPLLRFVLTSLCFCVASAFRMGGDHRSCMALGALYGLLYSLIRPYRAL